MIARYGTSLSAAFLIVAIGFWPTIVAPLGRAYISFCARYLAGVPFGHHYPPLVVAFVVPLIVLLIVGFAVSLVRQVLGQRSLEAAVVSHRDHVDERLWHIIDAVGLTGRVVVSRERASYAFCAGLVQPRVYLSRGMVDLLTADELEAVLWHERHHLDRRDPLRYFVAGLVDSLAAFFPVLATVSDRLRIGAEVAADEVSLRATSVDILASALAKVMRASVAAPGSAAMASFSPTDARIAALSGQPVTAGFSKIDVIASLGFALMTLVVISWLSVQPITLPPACGACPPF